MIRIVVYVPWYVRRNENRKDLDAISISEEIKRLYYSPETWFIWSTWKTTSTLYFSRLSIDSLQFP